MWATAPSASGFQRGVEWKRAMEKSKLADDEFLARMDQQFTGWSDPPGQLQSSLDNDELTLYCQPILALSAAGGYPMAEVLVRMNKEEKALLPPGDFLPVFEHF